MIGREQINIDIKFFASARELAGVSSCKLSLSAGSWTVLGAIEAVLNMYPILTESINEISIAVNKVYVVEKEFILKDGDVVAFIPPISGG